MQSILQAGWDLQKSPYEDLNFTKEMTRSCSRIELCEQWIVQAWTGKFQIAFKIHIKT